MASLLIGGIIATVIFISVGTVLALPPYIKGARMAEEVPNVLLTLSITDARNMPQWCQELSDLVVENQLKTIVYFSGEIAAEYPDCIKSFPAGVDIGSSTYTYTKLSADRDYLDQLEDVRKGKAVIDNITSTDSRAFKAPYGYTDENIYSLLSRNEIVADFSSQDSYNRYEDDKFILFPLKTIELRNTTVQEIEKEISAEATNQIQVTADNSVPIEEISSLVSTIIEKKEAQFVNASELTRLNLMVRRE